MTSVETTTPPKPKFHLNWIDCIRGIAALMVVGVHFYHTSLISLIPALTGQVINHEAHDTLRDTILFYREFVGNDWLDKISTVMLLGKVSIVWFFLVSGFVIPFSLFKYKFPIRSFLISRFFRLYPIYWFSLLLILVIGFPVYHGGLMGILANFTLFHKFVFIPDMNGVAWTLQIEIAFYLLCLFLFANNWLRSPKVNTGLIITFLIFALGLAGVRAITGFKAPIALGLGLSMTCTGMLWRQIVFRESKMTFRQFSTLMLAVVPLLLLICGIGYGKESWTYMVVYLFALASFFAISTGKIKLDNKFFNYVGQISYSLYLLHPLVGHFVIPFVIGLTPSLYSHHLELMVLPMLAGTLVSIGISIVTYQCIEVPFNQKSKEIIQGLKKSKNPPLPSLTAPKVSLQYQKATNYPLPTHPAKL